MKTLIQNGAARLRVLVSVLILSASASPFTGPALAAPVKSLTACEQADPSSIPTVKKRKRLKTFTAEFWEIAKAHLATAPKALQRQGFVIGDFHFSNLGLYYDYRLGRTQVVLNDLDDAGTSYLLGDLLKFMIYLHSVDQELNFEEVIQAYSKGLTQSKFNPMPENLGELSELAELLNYNGHQNQKNMAKYIAKKRDEALRFNSSDLTPEQVRTFALLEKFSLLQKPIQVNLSWLVTNKTGSSAGMDRYLFLATNELSHTQGILEFKELKCSATGSQSEQDIAGTYKLSRQYLQSLSSVAADPQSPLQSQAVVAFDKRAFLYRIKLPNLMNDLEIESTKKTQKFEAYAKYFARYLGFIHSRSSDAAYRSAIADKSNLDYILKEAKALKSAFNKSVKNAG